MENTKRDTIKTAIEDGAFCMAELMEDETVFHYTSIQAFKSIIESKVFFATEYHYLNDVTEFTYMRERLKIVLEQMLDDSDVHNQLKQAIYDRIISKDEEHSDLNYSYYVVSFSLSGDNLTLWQEFAGEGCNIEILPFEFIKTDGMVNYGRVRYKENEQDDLIKASIISAIEYYFDIEDASDENSADLRKCMKEITSDDIEPLAEIIVLVVSFYGMLMKQPMYEAEQEYRVVFSAANRDVKFRMNGNLIIPYIEVNLTEECELQALKKVNIAPLSKGQMNRYAIGNFLNYCIGRAVPIGESGLEMRY